MSRYRSEFTTREQQVMEALYLALVAPEQHIREACLLLARQFAVGSDASAVGGRPTFCVGGVDGSVGQSVSEMDLEGE